MVLRELENNFAQLESKILKINKDYKNLVQRYEDLVKEYALLERKYDEEKENHLKILEEYKKVKMTAAISGNPEHNKLMKSHINRLIKEIDACIAELQNAGM